MKPGTKFYNALMKSLSANLQFDRFYFLRLNKQIQGDFYLVICVIYLIYFYDYVLNYNLMSINRTTYRVLDKESIIETYSR